MGQAVEPLSNQALQALVERVSMQDFQRPFLHQAYWNKRLKTTGGRYHLASHDIDFNPKVLEVLGQEALLGVIRHELCHYHLHLSGRGFRHQDRDFKTLLQAVGGSRFVDWSQEERAMQAKYTYQCQACGALLYRQRRLNTRRYVCGKCKGRLVLVGQKK